MLLTRTNLLLSAVLILYLLCCSKYVGKKNTVFGNQFYLLFLLICVIIVYSYHKQAGITLLIIAMASHSPVFKEAFSDFTDTVSNKINSNKLENQESNYGISLEQRKNQQIENIRKTANTNKDASSDVMAAKQALEISKSSSDNDISRELEQIKLYNTRLEILDKEMQKWMEEGTGGLFKKNGLDKARTVKDGQSKERSDIDAQIKSSQDRIEKLRSQYALQVKAYNDRVSEIENRSNSQRGEIESNIKKIEKENDKIIAINIELDECSNIILEYPVCPTCGKR
jgi:chromosome segregation ATPase